MNNQRVLKDQTKWNAVAWLAFLTVYTLFSPSAAKGAADGKIVHAAAFPSGDAAWSIVVKDPRHKSGSRSDAGDAAPQERRILKLNMVRKGNLRRDIATWTDGSTSQSWLIGAPPVALIESEPGGSVLQMQKSYMGDERFDEATFAWASEQTFIGMKVFEGKSCRAYDREEELGEGETRSLHIWIDNDSGRPVAWSDGHVTAVFDFDVALPGTPLVLPPKFAKRLERLKAYNTPLKSYRAMRGKPQ